MYPRLLNGSAAKILGDIFIKAKNFNMLLYRHRLMSSHGAIPREHTLPLHHSPLPEKRHPEQKNRLSVFQRNIACPPCLAITLPQEIRNSPASSETARPGDTSRLLVTLFFIPPGYRGKNRYILLFPSGYTLHQ